MPKFDTDLTHEEWARQEAADAAEFDREEEERHRLKEDQESPHPPPKSWAPEVIADGSGKWCGNGLRFADREAAERWVADLSMRWTAVLDTRVVPSAEEPNR